MPYLLVFMRIYFSWKCDTEWTLGKMSVDVQVNRKLNEIINNLTDQKSIRAMHLKRLPLCIFYGEMPVELRQLFQTEFMARTGDDSVVEFVCAHTCEEMETAVKAAVCHFQEKAEKGVIPKVNYLYVPVLFMANQMEAAQLISGIRRMNDTMRRFGFEEEYEVGFYCIFDYEEMDGNECKIQLEKLQQDEKCRFPLGIFTQSNLVRTIEQRYLKAVQAISMHIFLQCSMKDSIRVKEQGTELARYTLSYWKLDILKQKITNNLMTAIENQNRQLITEGNYYEQIGTNIERIMNVELGRYQRMFMCMPIKHQKLTGKHYSPHELMCLLYEDQEAFTHFLEENIPDANRENIEAFMHMGAGNLYAVAEQLENILLKWKEFYSKEKDRLFQTLKGQERMIQITKKMQWKDIVESLCNYRWISEGKIFCLDRKIRFIDAVITYLNSQEFFKQKQDLRTKNVDYANRLRMIQGESLLHNGLKLDIANEKTALKENDNIPDWDMDMFSVERMEREVRSVAATMSAWMYDNAANVLTYFAAGLGSLKRQDAMKSFYAARLDIPKSTCEKEFLFLGNAYLQEDIRELQRALSTQIPRTELRLCEWETETCLEYFAVKEIEDLADIYAID